MNGLENISLKRLFLQSLIVSIGLCALLGILAIVMGSFGKFEVKVLLTTLTISGASLCGLCCGAAIEIRGRKGLGIIISPNGQTRVETKGFAGNECQQASMFLEEALGQRTSEQLTSEFYNSTEQQHTAREEA
jgi:hypothetical protein